MGGSSDDEHIVMLPMMAHGHLIPFLGLARQIQQRTGFTITIANTPLNINYLQSTTTSIHPKIRLAGLPFSSTDHGLPPNTENTENLPLDRIIDLFHASKSLKNPLHNLLLDITRKDGKPPLCIITDSLCGWAVDVAKSAGVVHVTFSTGGAYGTLGYMSLWLNLPHRKTDCDEFSLPGFPDRCLFHITHLHRFLRMADGSDSWSRYLQPAITKSLESYGMLCNTAEQIEAQPLDWLRKFVKIPVWSVGPLLHPALLNSSTTSSSSKQQHSGKVPGVSAEKCLEWLDLQPPGSVLYISFGSQNTISAPQMMGLARGLEQSKVAFIWVIRPPIGFDLKGGFRSEWLPEGFEERLATTKQGLLVKNWAPQLDILSHKSTGAFLSHCGWNSIMESLSQGVPIIGWPMAAEQGYNSKMAMEEMGVAVELTRGVQSSVEAKDVKKAIDLVMDNKRGKGKEMKENAVKIGEQIRAALMEQGEGTGSSFKSLDDFVQSLISRRAELSLPSNQS